VQLLPGSTPGPRLIGGINMGWRRYTIKCSECKKETALLGEDIDKKYTIEFYERQGWTFSKYDTLCPECRQKRKQEWEQIEMQLFGGDTHDRKEE